MSAFHRPERGTVCAPTRHTNPPRISGGGQISAPILALFWLWPIFSATYRPCGGTYGGATGCELEVPYRLTNPQNIIVQLLLQKKLARGLKKLHKSVLTLGFFFIYHTYIIPAPQKCCFLSQNFSFGENICFLRKIQVEIYQRGFVV